VFLGRLLVWLCVLVPMAWVPAHAAEQVVVQLNWKHQFEFAAFYAAESQGYYKDAGLDVRIVEGGPGSMWSRRWWRAAPTSVWAHPAWWWIGRGACPWWRWPRSATFAGGLAGVQGAGVQSVHDLAGRPVSVDPHTRDEIEAFLLASGLRPPQIQFVDQADWTLTALESGEVAAKAVYLSNEPFLIRGANINSCC
jgi:ABC-type nitrate/sulfonate/bicarbonate transport system substrate-binding protein